MKFIHLVSCFVLISANTFAQTIETSQPERGKITRVVTALNHLTVIEVAEPVTMVAAGSPSFKIERRDNKVFIQPLEEGQSTNLFIWTPTTRYAYELEPAGTISGMHFAIDHSLATAQPLANPPETAAASNATAAITRALVASLPVKHEASPRIKDRVTVTLTDILKLDDRLLIRYSVRNQGTEAYELETPQVTLMTDPRSRRSLIPLSLTQLDRREADRIQSSSETPVPLVHSDVHSTRLKPGEEGTGVIGITPLPEKDDPTVLRLHFAPDPKGKVTAILVL
jgi:hypothetical protein